MIGNDIVDLRLAQVQSNWRRKGFLDKVFTASEQSMISRSHQPDILVWKLWSMKESAYKARLRLQKKIKIDPLAFDCMPGNKDLGQVCCEGKIYHTISSIGDDFIHTYAYADKLDTRLSQDIVHMNQTNRVRKTLHQAVISAVAYTMDWKKHDLAIAKNDLGIPELYRRDKKTTILCSLSHHGRYGSYMTSC